MWLLKREDALAVFLAIAVPPDISGVKLKIAIGSMQIIAHRHAPARFQVRKLPQNAAHVKNYLHKPERTRNLLRWSIFAYQMGV